MDGGGLSMAIGGTLHWMVRPVQLQFGRKLLARRSGPATPFSPAILRSYAPGPESRRSMPRLIGLGPRVYLGTQGVGISKDSAWVTLADTPIAVRSPSPSLAPVIGEQAVTHGIAAERGTPSLFIAYPTVRQWIPLDRLRSPQA